MAQNPPGTSWLLYRWGLLASRWRWVLLALPLAISVSCIPLSIQVTHRLSAGGWLPHDSESYFVDQTLDDEFGRRTASHYILFRDPDHMLNATDPAFRREVERMVRPLRTDPAVISLYTWGTTSNDTLNAYLLSDDRSMSIAIVNVNQDIIAASNDVERFELLLKSDFLQAQTGGWPATTVALREMSASDLARAEWLSAPLTLLLLVLAFGGLLAACLPMLVAVASLIPALAVIAIMSRLIPTSLFSVNVVTMIGIAVGIDYALILINRYREEARVRPREQALASTVATAGRTIVVSGCAVAVGLMGLVAFGVPAATSTGIAGATVVLFSVILSLTMLPALLAVLDLQPGKRSWWESDQIAAWLIIMQSRTGRFRGACTSHPLLVLATSSALLLMLAAPLRNLDIASPTMAILPTSEEPRQLYDTIERSFSSTSLSPITVIVEPRRGRMTSARNLDDLRAFTDTLTAMDDVRSVTSVWSFLPNGPGPGIISGGILIDGNLRRAVSPYLNDRTAVIELGVHGDARSGASKRIVDELRHNGPAWSQGAFRISVGGETATNEDLIDHVRHRAPYAIGLMFLATWLILFAQFRSILLPLKAIVLNMLSLSASFGALVWIFQEGHLHGILDFEPIGYTVVIVPILMFCFMFGLSMDYEVIMLSRIREAWKQTGDNLTAIRIGVAASSGIVTSAALIMLVVFSAFGTSKLQIIKAMGVGLALAILVDATVIRLIVLPAAMQLMGRWNWWSPSLSSLVSILRRPAPPGSTWRSPKDEGSK